MKFAPILVIDKNGLIGEPLFLKLSKEFPVVFVSKKPGANVPFSKKFLVIPDNKYSHIIAIEDEGSDLEFLHTILKKAKGVNSNFIFVEELSAKGQYHFGTVLKKYSSSKIVLYGDIFGNKLILKGENFKSVVNQFIYRAQKFGKIQVVGDGLREVYPVFINDVVDGLIDLIFGINDRHSLFYIFPKHPPTELSLAHMIQKANPEVMIDFIKHDGRKKVVFIPPYGKYLLDDKYPLAKKIRSIDIQKKVILSEETNSQNENKRIKRFLLFIVWVLIFLTFSPLFFTLLFSFLGLNTLYSAKKQIERRDFTNVKSYLHLSEAFFYAGKRTSDALIYQARIVGRDKNFKRFLQDLDSGHKISQGLLQVFNAESYLTKVITGKSKNPTEDFAKGQNDLKNAISVLEKLRAEGKILPQFSKQLNGIRPLINLASKTSDVLPNIFGLDGQKTYLVLFQNNMELRPGGGFIGSYGILKINMGKIEDFSTYDVYDADRQLRGHVEPPFAIRRYLPSAHWYLRDSNFDVDFVKSASSSSHFLDIETGQKADGVIGVDVSFIKNVLHTIGPINIPDYKEKVDENNLYMVTQSFAQKKDFLRSLYKAMQAKISQGNIPYLLFIQAISNSLSQKHLILAFNNNAQDTFTVNDWSSSLWDKRKENKESINDFLGISETNLGVNKVNYFIKRKISQSIKIEESGSLSEELDISYKNTSNSWLGGDYKNYLRIILPLDTKIFSVSINDVSQRIVDAVTDFQIYEAKNFKPPIGLEVEKVNQDNKTIYGFLVNVRVEEIVKIKVKYNLAREAPLNLTSFSYNLRLFKQPGIDDLPYSFSLTYPTSFNVIKSSDGLSREEGKVFYSEKIVEDKNLIINFAKK